MKLDEDGVTHFKLEFKKTAPFSWRVINDLNVWRQIFYELKWIGQDRRRYRGVGFGNVSRRYPATQKLRSEPAFVVSGTQTGIRNTLTPNHYVHVRSFSPDKNTVSAFGPIPPSSESMTHGILYSIDPTIQFVFHVHCPLLWKRAERTGLLCTDRRVPYGTPEMVREVKRLFKNTDLRHRKIFVMKGHLDGVVSFGKTADEAGMTLIHAFLKALQI